MYCLDTNIIIFGLNKRRLAIADRIDLAIAAGTQLLIPAIAMFELKYGLAKSDRRAKTDAMLSAFLATGFRILDFDADDAGEAGEIRAHLEARGTPMGPYDILIAAQARRRGATLVTLNMREFERVPGLMVTDWRA